MSMMVLDVPIEALENQAMPEIMNELGRDYEKEKLIFAAERLEGEEKLNAFLKIGDEGYYRGYHCAALYYREKGELEKARMLLMRMGLNYGDDIRTEYDSGIINLELAYLPDTNTNFYIENAIFVFSKINDGFSSMMLGQIYDGTDERNGSFTNINKALTEYRKAMRANYYTPEVLYRYSRVLSRVGFDIKAACYCWLASLNDYEEAQKKFPEHIEKIGKVWEKTIKGLKKPSDVDQLMANISIVIKYNNAPDDEE